MARSSFLFAALAWLVHATDADCAANTWKLKARCSLVGKQSYDSADACMADRGVFEPYGGPYDSNQSGCGCCSFSSGGGATPVPTPRPTAVRPDPSDAGAPTPRPTPTPTRAPSSPGAVPLPTVNTVSRDSFPTAAPVAAPLGGGDDGEVDPAGAALDSDENNLDYEFADDDAAADAGTVAWLLCPYLLLALAGVIFIHLRMRRRRRAGGMGLDGAFRGGGGGGMFGGRTFGWGRGRTGPVYDVHLPLGVEMVEA